MNLDDYVIEPVELEEILSTQAICIPEEVTYDKL